MRSSAKNDVTFVQQSSQSSDGQIPDAPFIVVFVGYPGVENEAPVKGAALQGLWQVREETNPDGLVEQSGCPRGRVEMPGRYLLG